MCSLTRILNLVLPNGTLAAGEKASYLRRLWEPFDSMLVAYSANAYKWSRAIKTVASYNFDTSEWLLYTKLECFMCVLVGKTDFINAV